MNLRRIRVGRTIICLALGATLASCREVEIWSGARLQESGQRLELVARSSLCACVFLENKTDQPITVESVLRRASTGSAPIAPGTRLAQRFDWAGSEPDDLYILSTWDTKGTALRFADAVNMSITPWSDCAALPACEFKPLMMNVGLTGRNPGDR